MGRNQGPTWQPNTEDYNRVFGEQNPWHVSGRVPDELAKSVERPLATYLTTRIREDDPHRFQLILGPRRVGKTTSMYQCVRHLLGVGLDPRSIWWLRLDHPLLMDWSLGDLCRSLINYHAFGRRASRLYLFLDELTYASKWDLWLKTFFDEGWPLRIVGSSSSTAALRDRRLESGVGRWEEQYLSPYLFPEYLDLIGKQVAVPLADHLAGAIEACIRERVDVSGLADARRRFLITGGFPELLISGRDVADDEETTLLRSQRILKSDAVERAIYKDIPQAFGIDNPTNLERLLYTLAAQVTGILSPQSICRDLANLTAPTFDRYLAYLEQAFLVFTLQNYSGNESTVQKRGRKLYFVDGAVRNAALQRGLAPLTNSDEMGLLIENLVAGHLHALSRETQARLYYWRDKQDEVDFVLDHHEEPLAFEIALSGTHHRRGLRAFAERFPRFRGRCYLVAPEVPAILPSQSPDGIGSIPVDLLLLAAGSQAERGLVRRLA